MWEARAAEGRAAELEAWVRTVALPALRGPAGPERAELFTAPGERVLLITWWSGSRSRSPNRRPRCSGDPSTGGPSPVNTSSSVHS